MFLQDLRYAVRSFRGRPAVAAISVLSLSLGLGAAASAVSLLDAFGMRSPAIVDPGSLVQVRAVERTTSSGRMSYPDFEDVRDRARSFSSLAAYGIRGAGVSGPEAPPEVVLINTVSSDYFATLGVSAAIGRTLGPADSASHATPAVLLSDRLWRRRFNADAGTVGRTILVNGAECAVAGVLPRGFTGLDAMAAPDIWIPLTAWNALLPGASSELTARDSRWLTVVGRLRAPLSWGDRLRDRVGAIPVPIGLAQKEIENIAAQLRASYPATNRDMRLAVLGPSKAGARALTVAALLLWTLVALVVLVGCANVAGLLLGRAEDRRQEMAVRAALGARPRRLVRQLLTESAALAALAIALGLLFAAGIIRSLPALLPPMALPLGFDFRLDLRVIVATSAIGAATVLVFGLWPALAVSRRALAQAARGAAPVRSRRGSPRNVLVVLQIAVSFVLLVAGALLGLSLRNRQSIDPGFEVRPLLLATLSPVAAGYAPAASRAFFDDLVVRASAAPGVERVSVARRIPLDPNGGGAARDIVLPDRPLPADGVPLRVKYNTVAAGYFEIMGTRLTRGRAFGVRDGARDPKVVVINETMARRYWPDGPAIGERIRVAGAGAGEFEVIGVVADGKINRLTEPPQPYLFFCFAQVPSSEATLIVQAGADPRRAAPAVREVVRGLNPRVPLQMMTLTEHMKYASYEDRLVATVVTSLSVLGVSLTLIGLYGVVSFVVASRTREIGVRMALGARPADVLREVMRRAVVLTLIGTGIGVGLALAASQVLVSSLYGISAADPSVFAATAAGLLLVSLLSSWLPARRAMRVNPIDALRHS